LRGPRHNGLYAVANMTIIILCLFITMSLIIMNAVAAQTYLGPPEYQIKEEPRGPNPQWWPWESGCINCVYVGGFDDRDYKTCTTCKATAIKATFSFPDTNRAVIPSNNYLKGFVAAAVLTNKNSLDYGYRIGVELNRNEMIVWSEVWEFCEGLFPTSQCGFDKYIKLLHGVGVIIQASPSDKITVEMRWKDSNTVGFYYQINNGPIVEFSSFPRPDPAQSVFTLGYYTVEVNGRTAKYLQFSLFSSSNIGTGGWNLLIENPSFKVQNTWYLIPRARAVQGPNSWIDAIWYWGCYQYSNVDALYQKNSNIGPYKVKFYYTSSTLSDGTLLWG